MTCVAPQTRAYWANELKRRSDDQILRSLAGAEEGLKKHGKRSRRHWHDWVIYRACAIREIRRRGLAVPASTL